MLKRYSGICFAMLICATSSAFGAVAVKNDTIAKYSGSMATLDVLPSAEEQAEIATLENDIRILDEEIEKCEKKKKGWIAATVIGSVGTLSTGTAAIVQGVKIKEQKDDITAKHEELKNLQKENKALDGSK